MIIYVYIFLTTLTASTLTVDASNLDDWVYIKFDILGSAAQVNITNPENNLGWDIACLRYHFRTNSGLSGIGGGGAYVDSINTWDSSLYNSIIEVPIEASFVRDTTVNTFYSIDTHEDGLPGIANPALETWGSIDVSNEYLMEYSNHQFIVRDAFGTGFYKLWAVNYYNENGTSGHITIVYDAINPCSLGHDDCGECNGDNSSCSGCMDDTACNYNPMATINYGCDEDNDQDGICNQEDPCADNYDPFYTDRDGDGLYDACEDDNDDDPNNNPTGADCWSFALGEYPNTIFYDSNNNILTADEVAALAALGTDSNGNPCYDQDLAIDEVVMPEQFGLLQNYPNPFNPSTIIKYYLLNPSNISLEIFNINGEHILTLDDGFKPAGDYSLNWHGKDDANEKMPSGMYVYRLISNGIELDSKKMILLY